MDSYFHHCQLQKVARGGCSGVGSGYKQDKARIFMEVHSGRTRAMDRSYYEGNSVLQRKEFPMRALSIQMDTHGGFWKFSEFSWTTQQAT